MQKTIFGKKLKKAQVEMGIKPLIGLILAALIIVGTIGLFTGLLKIFTKDADAGSSATLKKFHRSMEALANPSHEYTSCGFMNYYVEADFAILGFNSEGVVSNTEDDLFNGIEEYCGAAEDDNDKPLGKCGSKACLCLCDGGVGDISGDDCDSGTCLKLSASISYFNFYPGQTPDKKTDLVVYGEYCGGTDKNVQEAMFIEKVKRGSFVPGGSTKGNEYYLIVKEMTNDKLKAMSKPKGYIECDKLVDQLANPEQDAKETTVTTSTTTTINSEPGGVRNDVINK
ncbi:hypothetical protein HN587_06550 [Candidatus Woesearchaeota archaeon]|jgi:hypothetical protein|nr:hypothetical protein [Candidatus Woesearchaeota archaeon]